MPPKHATWTYEVHELSEGYSAIVYDETGWAIADHLTEERASLIAAAPDAIRALELALKYWADRQQRYRNRAPVWVVAARAAISKATSRQPEGER